MQILTSSTHLLCVKHLKEKLIEYMHNKCSVTQSTQVALTSRRQNTHTHLMALCPGLPRWAGTRKVKPIWILLMQQTLSGSGIRWAVCKSAPRSRQITMPAPHHSVFHRPDALPAAQPTASKHWRHENVLAMVDFLEKLVFLYHLQNHCENNFCSWKPRARFTKYLTTILRLSYDNAKVTIDLRRTSNLQNILRRAQGFSYVRFTCKVVRSSETVFAN